MRIAWVVVVTLACSAPAWSQQAIFFDNFETADTSAWWAPARAGETGQKTCYDVSGAVLPSCAGTGQDGDLRGGVAWPSPRFVANGDGTVTDMLTGLIWLKDASCPDLAGTDTEGRGSWPTALAAAAALADGTCGLTDGSAAGDWRIPSIRELQSLFDYEYCAPALSNTAGTGQWTSDDAFTGVVSNFYWSSTTSADTLEYAWGSDIEYGEVTNNPKIWGSAYVWPVRGVQ